MVRLDDWPSRLSAYLRERKKMPFQWHVNDCMSFTAKAVEALTGIDYFSHYSDYHDEETARQMLAKNGGVVGIITKCLGKGSREVAKASRGDVVIVKAPEVLAGIVDDSGQRIVGIGETGFIYMPLKKAWRYWSY